MGWRTEIAAWEPPHRFVDERRSGPDRAWVREHRLEERDGGTLVTDLVRCRVPGGALVDRLLVRRGGRTTSLCRRSRPEGGSA